MSMRYNFEELACGLLCVSDEDRKEILLRMHERMPSLYEVMIFIMKKKVQLL